MGQASSYEICSDLSLLWNSSATSSGWSSPAPHWFGGLCEVLWSWRDPVKSLPTLGFVEPEQHGLLILFPRLAPPVSPSSWDSPSVLGQNRKGVKKGTRGNLCRVAGQERASMTTQGSLAPRTTAPLHREQWVVLALCLPPEDNNVSLILIIILSVSFPQLS